MTRGRKTKLTPETQKEICDNIIIGLNHEDAAILAGVSTSTFYAWKARGKKAKSGIYKEFLDALSEAEAEGERVLIKKIAAARPWQSDSWILERRHPEKWTKKEVSESDDKLEIIIKREGNE